MKPKNYFFLLVGMSCMLIACNNGTTSKEESTSVTQTDSTSEPEIVEEQNMAATETEELIKADWNDIEQYIKKQPNAQAELTGAIGPYDIHMFLNTSLEGYYYYDSHPKNRFKLRISKKADYVWDEVDPVHFCGGGHLELQEYTSKGMNSGEFKGGIYLKGIMPEADLRDEEDMNSVAKILIFEGEFRNKSNDKVFEFHVSTN